MAARGNTRGGKQSDSGGVDTALPGQIGLSRKFAMLNRLILRDLNNYTNAPTFSLFTKDDIARYLTNPYSVNMVNLRLIFRVRNKSNCN